MDQPLIAPTARDARGDPALERDFWKGIFNACIYERHRGLPAQGGCPAHSVKRVHTDATFHLVLSDDMPSCPDITTAAFDSIINIRDLPIDNLRSWIFRHRLVELCTAVKGTAFRYIAEKYGAERIY